MRFGARFLDDRLSTPFQWYGFGRGVGTDDAHVGACASHQHLFEGRPSSGCGNSRQIALSLPFEGKAGVVHEAAGRQFDGLSASDDGRDDIRCEEGEAQQPGDIGGNDSIGICDLLHGQIGVPVQLLANGECAD